MAASSLIKLFSRVKKVVLKAGSDPPDLLGGGMRGGPAAPGAAHAAAIVSAASSAFRCDAKTTGGADHIDLEDLDAQTHKHRWFISLLG